MSAIIYKWELKKAELQRITMPKGTKLLTVQMQNGKICMWGVVDTLQPMIQREIALIGTGWGPYPDRVMNVYIGTVQDGPNVWHFFAEEDEKYQVLGVNCEDTTDKEEKI